jgi:branched-chain amino acid transport system substrate-binding protein
VHGVHVAQDNEADIYEVPLYIKRKGIVKMKARILCLASVVAVVIGVTIVILIIVSPASAALISTPSSTWTDDLSSASLDSHGSWVGRDANHLEAAPVLTIGVAAALTGAPDIGWRQANAVQLAVDEANAAGGVDIGGTNYTLALAQADSGCNAGQAVNAANTLLDAGAVAVVGHTCSGASKAAQPLYAAAGVAMVSGSSTNPSVTEQGYTTTFRVISRDDSPAIVAAAQLRNRLGLDKVALVEMDGAGINYTNDVFSDTFTSLGGSITSRHAVLSTADYTATLTAIKAENPDAIFYPEPDPNNAGLLSHVAYGVGMNDVPIVWDTFGDDRGLLETYAAKAGTAAEGDYAAMHYRNSADMPGYKALNADYQAADFADYGDEVQAWGAFAYDAAKIILDAIDRADSTDPADIRDQIAATTNYWGVVGFYQGFDAKGDVIPQWLWLEQYRSGAWEVFWPYRVFQPGLFRSFGP